MKKILVTLIIIFFCNISYAQIQNPDTAAHKFAGTWRWTSGIDTVDIVLQIQYLNWGLYYSEDVVGWHRYVKNGHLVESSMSFVGTIEDIYGDAETSTLFGRSQSSNLLLLSFSDMSYGKREELRLTMLPGSLTHAIWELQDPRGIYAGPDGTAGLITLPRNIILTKQ